MVGWAALPVDRLPVPTHDHVHLTVVGHRLQRSVDRGEADAVTALAHCYRDVTHTVEVFGVCSRCAD